MPKLSNTLLACCLPLALLTLAGCSEAKQPTSPPTPTMPPAAGAPAATSTAIAQTGSGKAVSATGEATAEETKDFSFAYSFPGEAAAISSLRGWLDADRQRARAEIKQRAEEGREDAQGSDIEFHPYHLQVEWKKVAAIPGFLSLSAEIADYTDGAHGSFGFDSLVWDQKADARLKSVAMFASADALDKAVQSAFCDKLDAEREKKRAEKIRRDSGGMFTECIKPSEQAVILGSSDGKAFDRIGFLIAPYNAGPWAEGGYEVTLPLSEALLAAVKPEYRAAFAVR